MPFTIAVYMVRHYEEQAGRPIITTEDEQRVARLTGAWAASCLVLICTSTHDASPGLLASLFQAAQVLTSFLLGKISDSLGRKPILVLGNIAGTLSILAFGLAGTYQGAATARFVGGLLNGVIGCVCCVSLGACVVHPNRLCFVVVVPHSVSKPTQPPPVP